VDMVVVMVVVVMAVAMTVRTVTMVAVAEMLMDVAPVAVGLVMRMMRTVKNGEMTVTEGDDGRTNTEGTNTEDTDGRHGTTPSRPTCNGPAEAAFASGHSRRHHNDDAPQRRMRQWSRTAGGQQTEPYIRCIS